MNALPFIKMQGLGNDFVVLDARDKPIELSVEHVRVMSDRRLGAGCDQFIVMEPAQNSAADVFMRIRNSDASESEACGNATRCIARLIMEETGRDHVTIETIAGLLKAEKTSEGGYRINMGAARLNWNEIPTAEACNTLSMPVEAGPLAHPLGVNVGNPHAVFFVENAEAVDLETWGPKIETHSFFPEKINVEAAHIIDDQTIRMRVWERGVGVTQACGTGACATLVAAIRAEKIPGRKADVILDGGTLSIEWLENGEILMAGPADYAFRGTFDLSVFPGKA